MTRRIQSGEGDMLPGYKTYLFLERHLRQRIEAGEWPEGSMLPSRRDLARAYGVAVNTVQRAIARMVKDGVLIADEGRGTFVQRAGTLRASALALGDQPGTPSHGETIGILYFAPPPDETRLDAEYRYFTSWDQLVVNAAERAISAEGGRTIIINTCTTHSYDFEGNTDAAIQHLQELGVDAIMIVGINDDIARWTWVYRRLCALTIPVIYVCYTNLPALFSQVYYDQQSAGFLAAQHLLQQGYRQIYCVTPYHNHWIDARIEGMRIALANHGAGATFSVFPHQAPDGWDHTDAMLPTFQPTLTLGFSPDGPLYQACRYADSWPVGLIGITDTIAIALLSSVHANGFSVGAGVGVIGFDDSPMAQTVGLTSLRPPFEALGALATRQILDVVRGRTIPVHIRVAHQLMQRASTMPSHTISKHVANNLATAGI